MASRDSAFAIAVATSAVNFTIRSSVSGGGDSSFFQLAVMTPHGLPSTEMGAETLERRPVAWASSASAPPADS